MARKKQRPKKFPGMTLTERSTLTRLKADCQRLEGLGYTGIVAQADALGDAPLSRIAQAQNIVSDLLWGDMTAHKNKVSI